MKLATLAVAYNEQRLIEKHLKHIPEWIDKKLVLVSAVPWHGDYELPDNTDKLASKYADVIVYPWENEAEQRNAGLDYLSDYDWVIILDPDEFLDNTGWENLREYLKYTDHEALVCDYQLTYWKDGYVADPPRDYQMLIAVKPSVRFAEKRVVDTGYGVAPVKVHHFSWARTDDEVWSKITHYEHSKDFDTLRWFNEVWMNWKLGVKDVHPTTPDTLHDFKKAKLPKELERLDLWPKPKRA